MEPRAVISLINIPLGYFYEIQWFNKLSIASPVCEIFNWAKNYYFNLMVMVDMCLYYIIIIYRLK